MASERDWGRAFLQQARADLVAREALVRAPDIPPCQELHFLQMACEKLSKAHLYFRGSPPPDIQSSHGHSSKQLPLILREIYRRRGGRENTWLFPEIRILAREIALLHPQVDDGGARPDNCEYPWLDQQGNVIAPADHSFAELALARSQAGREFLKLLTLAVEEVGQR